ncbi:F0F1 ATP synthase subunit delta [Streptococcus chenjunshii]|uniref:ATP synthase subunit delta n=1 Tax=Streptococcus chenjunshii TaxID=2173853 RepID=A0A372KLS3_9STRE|nr:F0F1 ATP synthase subunit delta [Streptococcus chenjunshii]AXQ78360.1 F0F1 ATP synthase subunit delta [Streptococcus chenjunshii]RFU50323.1 F0F1 ATP synthase subunit delta [Streptococcus chenjunshii]RFU52528.1 F0F1 ATP synthase subunit delta [Streptococcus chenjunshii]
MNKKTQALLEQYAKSFVAVALEQQQAESAAEEIDFLLKVFAETELAASLSHDGISRSAKADLIRTLQKSSSFYLSNFLEVILHNEREAYLYDILKLTSKKLTAATNSHAIVVTSAVPLTERQRERVLKIAAERLAISKGRLVEKIDQSVVGGLIINANNQVIDMSIRRQLQEFKMNLK